MGELKISASAVVKQATDILFVKNPVGTSMGTFFGIVLHGLVSLISPALQSIETIRISSLSVFHYVAFGIFSFNIKNLAIYHKVSPEIEEALTFIESQVQKGNISRIEARQRYRQLIDKAVENIQLKNSAKGIPGLVGDTKEN